MKNAPDPWQTLKGFAPFRLREIKEGTDPSKPWQDWRGKQGVIMLRVPGRNDAAKIGMTADGKIEAGLSDLLYGLDSERSRLGKRLKEEGVSVRDCEVYVIEIKDPASRKEAKNVGIKHFMR